MFQKATRRKAKLKLTITGPSGAGKTLSSLLLAKGIVEVLRTEGREPKIALLDTENESASLYADQVVELDAAAIKIPDFDTMSMVPPYTTQKYIAAINLAVSKGYDILIIDSGTHQWAGEGGILSRKEAMDTKPGSNSYTNWAKMTPEQEQFKSAILNAQIHLIMTLRSKQDYVLSKDERGKQVPQKVGMAPIQRDGMEYEFTTVFDADMTHQVTVSKDRTGLFDGKYFKITDATGKTLANWLMSGEDALPKTTTSAVKPLNPDEFITGGSLSGKRISDLILKEDASLLHKWMIDAEKYFVEKAIDVETSQVNTARSYRAARALIAAHAHGAVEFPESVEDSRAPVDPTGDFAKSASGPITPAETDVP